MATDINKPSFSRRRKWTIGFNVVLTVVLVLAVAVMLNYLGSRYFKRFYLSSKTQIELSPRTLSLLKTITNKVQVTVYYDKDEPIFSDVSDLLKQYRLTNPKIQITTVDYLRDPGAAIGLRTKYNLGAMTNKNWVIFDCDHHVQKVEGGMLAQYTLEQIPSEDPNKPEFQRKMVAFNGEMMFTSSLLAVLNPNPLHASFLQGHGEHLPSDTSVWGFSKFVSLMQQNYVQVTGLELVGTNTIPADCNLLVIAGPRDPFSTNELASIQQYLTEGGRLLVMFNLASTNRETGLENLLKTWGVAVGSSTVSDPDHTKAGTDVIVEKFSKHPAVNPLINSAVQMTMPRPISAIDSSKTDKEGLQVDEIAFAGPNSVLRNGPSDQTPKAWPLMAAVERVGGKAPASRGLTRILVLGDSIFLGDYQIQSGANLDFANYALAWLLERNVFAQGVGPRPVTEFRLLIPQTEMRTLQWILLAAVPGGILLLGGVVWLVRRK